MTDFAKDGAELIVLLAEQRWKEFQKTTEVFRWTHYDLAHPQVRLTLAPPYEGHGWTVSAGGETFPLTRSQAKRLQALVDATRVAKTNQTVEGLARAILSSASENGGRSDG